MSKVKFNADQVKATVEKSITDKTALKKHENFTAIQESILEDMPSAVKQLDALRQGSKDRRSIDLSFAEFAKEKWGFAPSDNGAADSLYLALGINPSQHTIESLMSMPDMPDGYRWIVPEVIREAIRVGLRKNAIYPGLIAAEETVTQPTVTMPFINQSDATMKRVAEGETIPVGSVSFGQKTVKIYKAGVGIKMTDEVRQFVPLNLLAIYLQDIGIKLNLGLDTMAISTLINGDQTDGSGAITQVGVDTVVNGITYDKDLLKAWIKMGRLGKLPEGIISNEDAALNILALPEFKGFNGLVQKTRIEMETAIPQTQKYWIHGAMPTGNKIMMVDPKSALVKLNASALRLENERIVERQITGTFATVHTGFATVMDDARLLIDGTSTLVAKPYPASWNVSGAENVIIS